MSALLEEVRLALALPSPGKAREIRQRAGISRERMARELGIHAATVARWEEGRFRPRGRMRLAYAELLNKLSEAVAQ